VTRTHTASPRILRLADRLGARPAPHRLVAGLSVLALLAGAIALVYLSGGPRHQIVHVLYVPVLAAAVLFGTAGGLLTGVAAGFLTGPWMASAGFPGAPETMADWGIRMAMLAVVGTLAGAIQSLLWHRLTQVEGLVGTLSATHAKTLSTFASTIELRDRFTGGHSNRVARNARAVAQALDLEEDVVRRAYWSGLLHDLGKIAVPERILLKPGPLTPEEIEVMRRHSSIGADLLEAVSMDFQPIAEGVRCHHERWDGAGYPGGLAGESIPLVGRILGVVDVFEALTCLRPYRGPSDPEEAMTYVRGNIRTQFDPGIVEVFEGLFWRGEIFTASDPRQEVIEHSIRIPEQHAETPVVLPELMAPDPLFHLGSTGGA
jgi:HD domain